MSERNIIINQPRASYFVGGAEMVSLQHARYMQLLGNSMVYTSINPSSINHNFSNQYLDAKYNNPAIEFNEINQPALALPIYDTQPGESRDRWNIESMHFNSALYQHLLESGASYDNMLSYYKFDSLVIPRRQIARSALYLCGIPRQPNEFMSSYLAMYDDVIAITDETRDYWEKYCRTEIPVVTTGVDTSRFNPQQDRNNREKMNVTFIGRLIERKGCDQLIRALGCLPERLIKSLNVQIVGDGPQLENLRLLARALDDRVAISFLGALDAPETILNDSDICVLPSRNGEGLQGVLLEALSSGNIVIASDTKINQEILDQGRGIVIDSSSVSSISSAITRAVGMVSDNATSIDDGQRYIKDNFAWEFVTKQLLERMGQ